MASRRPDTAEDEGQAGFSGKNNALFSTSYGRRPSYRSFYSLAACQSPRSTRFYDARFEEPPHFLEACFLCKKPLGNNEDIFMYRGDTPFCSEECRQEQIRIDEAKERNWNLSAKVSSRKTQQKSTTKDQNFPASKTGTVAAS